MALVTGRPQARAPDINCCAQLSVYRWKQETCHLHSEQRYVLSNLARGHGRYLRLLQMQDVSQKVARLEPDILCITAHMVQITAH